MLKVLIALDGPAVDTRIVELAGTLLAGKEVAITLLHVGPVPLGQDQGWSGTAVLEGFHDAEACGGELALLAEQLHARLGASGRQDQGAEPWLLPRHLMHRADALGVIDRCDIAHERRDSVMLLAGYARRLEQHGLDVAAMTRDSAIGDPATVIWETARHLGVDLLILGHGGLRHAGQIVDWPGWAAHAPCPVLVVPETEPAVSGTTSCGPV